MYKAALLLIVFILNMLISYMTSQKQGNQVISMIYRLLCDNKIPLDCSTVNPWR